MTRLLFARTLVVGFLSFDDRAAAVRPLQRHVWLQWAEQLSCRDRHRGRPDGQGDTSIRCQRDWRVV
jgi:hypothetical protein